MPLHPRPDLARLKAAARQLQRAAAAGDPEALRRIGLPEGGAVKLAHAQRALAREAGFANWAQLKAHVEARAAKRREAARRRAERQADARALAAAWLALGEPGDPAAFGPALAVGKRRLEAARTVMRADPDAYGRFVAALVAGLADPRPRVRFECAHALDQFGDAACRPALIALMDDPVPKVRWMAMHALTCHGCGEGAVAADPALEARMARHALEDPSIQVRRHAAVALGFSGGTVALETLQAIAAEAVDPGLRRAAAWGLRGSG